MLSFGRLTKKRNVKNLNGIVFMIINYGEL